METRGSIVQGHPLLYSTDSKSGQPGIYETQSQNTDEEKKGKEKERKRNFQSSEILFQDVYEMVIKNLYEYLYFSRNLDCCEWHNGQTY